MAADLVDERLVQVLTGCSIDGPALFLLQLDGRFVPWHVRALGEHLAAAWAMARHEQRHKNNGK